VGYSAEDYDRLVAEVEALQAENAEIERRIRTGEIRMPRLTRPSREHDDYELEQLRQAFRQRSARPEPPRVAPAPPREPPPPPTPPPRTITMANGQFTWKCPDCGFQLGQPALEPLDQAIRRHECIQDRRRRR